VNLTELTEQMQADMDAAARENFPESFWYYHRLMGNTLTRYGFTLDTLSRLGHGDWQEAHMQDPVVTVCADGEPRRGGHRDWTGTAECRWWHWADLINDIPNVGPRRMLELVNFLRSVKVELPWFTDFDIWSANWVVLKEYRREPPVPEGERADGPE
jgi:hypothetical protein